MEKLNKIYVINSILCIFAFVISVFLLTGIIMGAASLGDKNLDQATIILWTGLFMPGMPVISILGSWLTRRWTKIALGFVVLPWLYIFSFFSYLAYVLSSFS